MIAKIVKGSGFREVTGYIIDSKKNPGLSHMPVCLLKMLPQ